MSTTLDELVKSLSEPDCSRCHTKMWWTGDTWQAELIIDGNLEAWACGDTWDAAMRKLCDKCSNKSFPMKTDHVTMPQLTEDASIPQS